MRIGIGSPKEHSFHNWNNFKSQRSGLGSEFGLGSSPPEFLVFGKHRCVIRLAAREEMVDNPRQLVRSSSNRLGRSQFGGIRRKKLPSHDWLL
jgi:hypothetical protein